MTDAVKPRRAYDASRRQEQARRTRAEVLRAAEALFLERGYAATTVAAVADAAAVSVETVYKAFRNKAGLAKALFDVAAVGDDEPIPMVERPFVQAIDAEPDPRRKLEIYAEHLVETNGRTGPIQLVIRAAAGADPGAAELWAQLLEERLTGMGMMAQALFEGGHLRPGLAVEEARDSLWTLIAVEQWEMLVQQRGWTPDAYGRWIARQLAAALL